MKSLTDTDSAQQPFPELDIARFEAAEIDAEAFDHERHLYIGWLLLQDEGLGSAIARFSRALRKITQKFGCEDKYHETITWMFMILIAERCLNDPAAGWPDFARQNADLIEGGLSVLDDYYSRDRLWSEDARSTFLLPDLQTVGRAA